MAEYLPLNLPLMSNPVNWIIVALMVLLGGFLLSLATSATVVRKEDQEA